MDKPDSNDLPGPVADLLPIPAMIAFFGAFALIVFLLVYTLAALLLPLLSRFAA